jgi:predicted nucleotidyltransferase
MEGCVDTLIKRAEIVRSWKEYMNGIVKAMRTILADSRSVVVCRSAVKVELTEWAHNLTRCAPHPKLRARDIDVLAVSRSNLGRRN